MSGHSHSNYTVTNLGYKCEKWIRHGEINLKYKTKVWVYKGGGATAHSIPCFNTLPTWMIFNTLLKQFVQYIQKALDKTLYIKETDLTDFGLSYTPFINCYTRIKLKLKSIKRFEMHLQFPSIWVNPISFAWPCREITKDSY